MSETLLAFLGILILVLFSLQQQRAVIQHQTAMMQDEVEIMAHAVGSQRLQFVASRQFDQRGSNADIAPSALTPFSDFGSETNCETKSACKFLERFHNTETESSFFVGLNAEGDSVKMPFRLHHEVYYVDQTGDTTTARTRTKRIIIRVEPKDTLAMRVPPVRLHRDRQPQVQ